MQYTNLTQTTFKTPLGPMMAIANNTHLHLLAFADQKNLARKTHQFERTIKSPLTQGLNNVLELLIKELHKYFAGQLRSFQTPVHLHGTVFQASTWHALSTIPYGQTRSYHDQASIINKPSAYRAVANANAANRIAIIVPCHRIIRTDGTVGGYAGGLSRKEWLIIHEKQHL